MNFKTVSVEHLHPVGAVLTISEIDTDRSVEVRSLHVALSPDKVHTLVQQLLGQMHPNEVAQAAQAGPCDTCQMTRLVEVERRGKPWKVPCPDCRGDFDMDPWKRLYDSLPDGWRRP